MRPQPVIVFACLFLGACSESNNLLLGTVSANIENHHIVVTDCYRPEPPKPEKLFEHGASVWLYTPCRDAVIEIRGDKLTVNGRAYGHMNPDDDVLVDHGNVSIQHRATSEHAPN